MARRRKEDEEETPPGPGPIRLFFRFFNTLLVLAIIAYGAARAITFTAGFKTLIEEQLLIKFGLPVSIGKVRSNWSCDLEFSNVATTNKGDEVAGSFRAKRIDLEWSLAEVLRGRAWDLRKLSVTGCEISFLGRDGAWEPVAFSPISSWLARWLDVSLPAPSNAVAAAATNTAVKETAAVAPGDRWSNTVFSVQDMALKWMLGPTVEVASADGLWIDVAPLQVPDRKFRYYRLKLNTARAPDGTTIRNVNLELIDTGDQQVVLGLTAERQKPSK